MGPIKKLASSPKTTSVGLAAIAVALGAMMQAVFDNDPTTQPDWASFMAALTAGLVGLFARDNSTTSEAAGAAKKGQMFHGAYGGD